MTDILGAAACFGFVLGFSVCLWAHREYLHRAEVLFRMVRKSAGGSQVVLFTLVPDGDDDFRVHHVALHAPPIAAALREDTSIEFEVDETTKSPAVHVTWIGGHPKEKKP